MATTEEQWARAFSLLQQFERQRIEPSSFLEISHRKHRCFQSNFLAQ